MDCYDFASAWVLAMGETFEIYAQPVTWNRKSYQAVVDALPYGDGQRAGGGGFVEEFQGSIIFLKSDFTTTFPQTGDEIQVGKRLLRIVEVANKDDAADPTLHCFYKPMST